MVERVDFNDGNSMMVSTSHLERMYEDGFIFRYLLNGHPSMKEERSTLDITMDEFSMVSGVLRRMELPLGDKRHMIAELNDRLGGFRAIDQLLMSSIPRTPAADDRASYDWEFVRFGYGLDYERELALRAKGYVFGSLVTDAESNRTLGQFLRRPRP